MQCDVAQGPQHRSLSCLGNLHVGRAQLASINTNGRQYMLDQAMYTVFHAMSHVSCYVPVPLTIKLIISTLSEMTLFRPELPFSVHCSHCILCISNTSVTI